MVKEGNTVLGTKDRHVPQKRIRMASNIQVFTTLMRMVNHDDYTTCKDPQHLALCRH